MASFFDDGNNPERPGASAAPPLAFAISSNCGHRHEILNKLIQDYMPIALPPCAKDTHLYFAGLESFGMIYMQFESAWKVYLDAHPDPDDDPKDPADGDDDADTDYDSDDSDDSDDEPTAPGKPPDPSPHTRDIVKFLRNVRPDGIYRSPRLRQDLKYLKFPGEADKPGRAPPDGMPRRTHGRAYRTFKKHIRKTGATRPHALYAYAWCMYMAIFAGGRYIREALADAGEDFWTHHGMGTRSVAAASPLRPYEDEKESPLDRLGYSFLSFHASDDGESIKEEFQKRLFEAEALYTKDEKEDVIAEAKRIYDMTIDLVREMRELIRPAPGHGHDGDDDGDDGSDSDGDDDDDKRPERPGPPKRPDTPDRPGPPEKPQPPPAYAATAMAASAPPSYFDSEYAGLEKGLYGHSRYTDDGDGGDDSSSALLRMRASDEEWLEWRSEARPMRRGPLFWAQLVLLVAVMSAVMFGLVFGARYWAWREGMRTMAAAAKEAAAASSLGRKPCHGRQWW